MWGEFDISPLREASAFGAGIGRCVVIEIVAHKNGSQGENKLTAQLQIDRGTAFVSIGALRVFPTHSIHGEARERTCLPRRRQSRREHRPEQLSDGPSTFSSQLPCHSFHSPTPVRCSSSSLRGSLQAKTNKKQPSVGPSPRWRSRDLRCAVFMCAKNANGPQCRKRHAIFYSNKPNNPIKSG